MRWRRSGGCQHDATARAVRTLACPRRPARAQKADGAAHLAHQIVAEAAGRNAIGLIVDKSALDRTRRPLDGGILRERHVAQRWHAPDDARLCGSQKGGRHQRTAFLACLIVTSPSSGRPPSINRLYMARYLIPAPHRDGAPRPFPRHAGRGRTVRGNVSPSAELHQDSFPPAQVGLRTSTTVQPC